MPTLIDSYSETNGNKLTSLYNTYVYNHSGQAFTCSVSNYTLDSAKFYLRSTGSPTGNLYAKLYAITGTVGSTAIPTGSPLATSSPVNVTTLSDTPALIEFSFNNTYELSGSTGYAIVVYFNSGDGDNKVYFYSDSTSPTHSGNRVNYNTWKSEWVSDSSEDSIFYIYGEEILPPTGGSEVDVDITAEGSGIKKTESGSETDTDITADGGAGEKIAYSTSSYGSVSITAEGGGRPLHLSYFLNEPKVTVQGKIATHVLVKSPTNSYTAIESPAPSSANEIWRYVEIAEGDSTVCQTVAEALLEKWGKELVSVEGDIKMNLSLPAKRKIHITIPYAGIDREMVLQSKTHNRADDVTHIVLGDIILSDDELIARIIDELG